MPPGYYLEKKKRKKKVGLARVLNQIDQIPN